MIHDHTPFRQDTKRVMTMQAPLQMGSFSCLAIMDDAPRYPIGMFLTNLARELYEPLRASAVRTRRESFFPRCGTSVIDSSLPDAFTFTEFVQRTEASLAMLFAQYIGWWRFSTTSGCGRRCPCRRELWQTRSGRSPRSDTDKRPWDGTLSPLRQLPRAAWCREDSWG